MTLYSGDQSPYSKITWITTGFQNLDTILGGGIPTRKITEISGQYSVGKSTLALQTVAEAQKQGFKILWCDTEVSWGADYAASLGVEVSQINLLYAEHAEAYLDEIQEWAEKNKNSLIVIDSIGGLLPRNEAEKDASGKVIGGQAKLIATFCRKMVPLIAMNNIALLVLNHNFTDLMTGKIKTSGGAKLEYAKSIWLMLRKANKRLMSGDTQVGDVIECEIRKQKLASTLKQSCEIQMLYGQGFSRSADLMQEAINKGIITKQGNSFFFGEKKLAVGQAKLREALKDETLQQEIKALL